MGTYLKAIILIIVLLFLVTFGVKNSHFVQLHYYGSFLNWTLPIYGLVYICMVIGIAIGMIVGLYKRMALQRTLKALKKENMRLQERVKEEQRAEENTPAPGEEARS